MNSFTEFSECVNEGVRVLNHSSNTLPSLFFVFGSWGLQNHDCNTHSCNLMWWFVQSFECRQLFNINDIKCFFCLCNLRFCLFQNFLSLLLFYFNFHTFLVQLFLFFYSFALILFHIDTGYFNLFQNCLNLNLFSIHLFLFNL